MFQKKVTFMSSRKKENLIWGAYWNHSHNNGRMLVIFIMQSHAGQSGQLT